MGFWASLEVERGKFLGTRDTYDEVSSRAMPSFLLSLSCLCDLRGDEAPIRDSDKEILDWYSAITSRMTQPLCSLTEFQYGPTEWSETEYESYKNGTYETSPDSDFLKLCMELEELWLDIGLMRDIIDDLIRVIDEIDPPEAWWFGKPESISDFRLFSQALSLGIKLGYTKVRIKID